MRTVGKRKRKKKKRSGQAAGSPEYRGPKSSSLLVSLHDHVCYLFFNRKFIVEYAREVSIGRVTNPKHQPLQPPPAIQ